VVSTILACTTYGVVLIISAITPLVIGFLIGNEDKRILNVNQTYFFWLGRDRIVFNKGLTLKVDGFVLLGIGLVSLYLGLTIRTM
jgi:hypothetical protein